MSVGPIIIFDKSTLQGLNVDESVWLDTHYLSNITPLFFVETLADLEKEVSKGRTPEQVVGNLAEKTPLGGRPNVHHMSLCIGELIGHPIEMSRRPVVGGGKPVSRGGKRGVVFEQAPEIDALQRWETGKFLEVERHFARAWREALSNIDLSEISKIGNRIIENHGQPRNLEEAKSMAITVLDKTGSRYARTLLEGILPESERKKILERWATSGYPPLRGFAPYTAHVLTIDLFFSIALASKLISQVRQSNKIDLAYLYYLPFCMIFTSNDNLHKRTAPLFLADDQMFISGAELKADLSKLDEYYSALPDETKARGVMSFAHYPPTDGDFLVSKLWDKFMATWWREGAAKESAPISAETQKKISQELHEMEDAPKEMGHGEVDKGDLDYLIVERKIPVIRGKWRMVPPEAVKKSSS